VVIYANFKPGYGRLIKIRHSFGLETRYGHLLRFWVKVGQIVSLGDKIDDMGI
jgi:murein DD-endopeptidase MepM/ murein hydrolase activator NlpD